jgi:hypothetical protein
MDIEGKLLILDRGFFSDEVIEHLSEAKIDYVQIMFYPPEEIATTTMSEFILKSISDILRGSLNAEKGRSVKFINTS